MVQFVQAPAYIVTVERDVQLAITNTSGVDLRFQQRHDPVGEKDASRLDADQYGIFQVQMILQQLMR